MAEWTIRTYYKKSSEQHEHFYNRKTDQKIIVKEGFRSVEYKVITTDDKFPQFEFAFVPDGDEKKDSLDLNSLIGSNIEYSEMIEMFDGGCWIDIDIQGVDDEDEEQRLEQLISEEGSYALEEDGDWYLSDTEVWVWGPLEVTDQQGQCRIICASEDGTVIDFIEK
jgi:hypothetical protein